MKGEVEIITENLVRENENEEYDYEDEEDSCTDSEEELDTNISINGELNDPLKKKRGRKPKPKEDDDEKGKKKRGRRPKPKEEDDGEDKVPKKRGRKPKEKVYSVKDETAQDMTQQIEKQETVILHLPIKNEQDKTESEKDPTPFIKKNVNYSMISSTYAVNENVDINQVKIIPKKKMDDVVIVQKQEDPIEPIGIDIKQDYDQNYSFLDNESEEDMENEEIVKQEKEEKKIVEEKEKIDISRVVLEDDYRPNKIIKKNLRNIMYEFVNSNSAQTWPESTNTCCWWCCHNFNWTPCALPEVYRKDKFYVSGVYCCFNCAASYNFSKNDGEDMWTRYSLLNLMYKKMYGTKFIKIGLAPPRESLTMFGGYMTIDEFRESCLKMDRTFNVIKPPLVAIIPKIEENMMSKGMKIGNGINENILNKTQNNLKLKRNKPLMNPNSTLQSFMNIKIV